MNNVLELQNVVLPPRRTQAENRVFRRESLLGAAISAVARYDITGATVERICGLAGASRGLIAHYFDSKNDLLLAALNSLFNDSLKIKREIAGDELISAQTRIKMIANSNFVAPTFSLEKASALQAFTNASRHNAIYADPIHNASVGFCQIVAPLFKQSAMERNFKLDAKRAAIGLYVLTDGLWNSLATNKDQITPKDAMAQCDTYIRGCFMEETEI